MTRLLFLILWIVAGAGIGALGSPDERVDQLDRHVTFRWGVQGPGLAPEIFAPGVVSEAGWRLHGCPTFSPDGQEMVWPVIPPALMYSRWTDTGWITPVVLNIDNTRTQAPFFSSDGHRLYFQCAREGGSGGIDIWYITRTDSGWSAPINLGSPPNSPGLESQPTLTSRGTLYFTGSLPNTGMNRGIYRSQLVDGVYRPAEPLHPAINSPYIDYTPYIAPDESFLLFSSSRPDSLESSLRLSISFRDSLDRWSPPFDLSAKLGLTSAARFPGLTPDGEFLLYLSAGKIFWVSAEVLRGLRAQ